MSRQTRATAFFFLFALAAAAQSPTQTWNDVKMLAGGTSVRISAGSHTVSGQLQEVTNDSIAVESDKKRELFKRQDVRRVSVKKAAHRGRNTLLGLGVGAATGGAIGAIGHKDCTGFCILSFTRGQDAAICAVAFGVIGTAVGALIPTGGWREIYRQ